LALSDFDLSGIRTSVNDKIFILNDDFIQVFGVVNSDIEELGKQIQSLENQVVEMQETLEKAKEDTRTILEQTKDLTIKSKDAEENKRIAQAFLDRFMLSQDEIQALSTENVNDQFFNALSHLQQIHQDCKVLLVAEHQRAGLEIMDSMNSYQEIAYERLFKWTQSECRMMRNESPEISSEFKKAMHAFRLRPILFEY
jgi:HD-GYP domain-containing protein (c-di-GMP phosphodiesterase class II)